MCQVLDDFLGVLCLACSRLTPANRVNESSLRCGFVLILRPTGGQCCCLPLCPSVGPHEGANMKRKEQQPNGMLWNLLSVCFLGPPEPDKSRCMPTAYPGHLATFRANVLDIREAAGDLGAKGTNVCSLQTFLRGSFCFMNSPPY